MLDGINLSDGNAGTLSSLLGVNLDDVERIRVVPGVSSALYGSDAIGGVVNIISKMPTKQESTVKLRGYRRRRRETYEASFRNRWDRWHRHFCRRWPGENGRL